MRKLTFLLLVLLQTPFLFAQDKGFFNIEAGTGLLNYNGDIDTRFLYPDWEPTFSLGLSLGLDNGFGLRLHGLRGSFVANDRGETIGGDLLTDWENFDRALNVHTEIYNATFSLMYYLDNGYILPESFPVSPYLGAGVGYTWFTPYGDLLSAGGDRYFYWSDNTVRLTPETLGDPATTPVIEQDGDYETSLRRLQTEGEDYDEGTLTFPLTFGLSWRFSSRLRLNLEATYFLTRTDYLDDVSEAYAPAYPDEFAAYAANPSNVSRTLRGNNEGDNDQYYYVSAAIAYRFSWGLKKFKANALFAPPAGYSGGGGPVTENQRLIRGDEWAADKEGSRYTSREAPKGVSGEADFTTMPIVTPFQPSRKDTVEVLEVEVEKLELYNKWYSLRLNSPDPAISYGAKADSTIKARKADSLYREDFPIMTLEGITDSRARKAPDTLKRATTKAQLPTRPTIQPQRVTDERIRAYRDSIAEVERQVEELRIEDSVQQVRARELEDSMQALEDRQEAIIAATHDSLLMVRDSLNTAYARELDSLDRAQDDSLRQAIDRLEAELDEVREASQQEVRQEMAADTIAAGRAEEAYRQRIQALEDSLAMQRRLREEQLLQSTYDSADIEAYRQQLDKLDEQVDKMEEEREELQEQMERLEDELKETETRPESRVRSEQMERLEEELERLRREEEAENRNRDRRKDDDRRKVNVQPTIQPVVSVGGGEKKEKRKTRQKINELQAKIDSLELEQQTLQEQVQPVEADDNTAVGVASVASPDSAVEARLSTLQAQMDSIQVLMRRELEAEAADTVQAAPAERIELPSTAVFFRSGSFALSAGDQERIRQLANYASRNPAIRIMLHGYTDATGNAQQNLILSQRRAASVQAELVKNGIRADRVEVEYFGVSPNLDKEASPFGRRVEILLEY